MFKKILIVLVVVIMLVVVVGLFLPTNYEVSYVNITAPAGATVTLDGTDITAFAPIGASGYGALRVQLNDGDAGNHLIASDVPDHHVRRHGKRPVEGFANPLVDVEARVRIVKEVICHGMAGLDH